MIQEVFGGAASNSLLGDPKFSFHGSPSPSPSEKAPHESPATKASTATCESNINKLRCPRCDSANTKFCYYNNYNLTQPRHFCKTCRRYWTKGDAMRNVPIGGGCRKNKTTSIVTTSSSNNKSTTPSKLLKTVSSSSSSSPTQPGFDQLELPSYNSNTSHLLALLRSTSQNPNHSHNPVSSHLAKQENMVGGHMMMPNTNHPLPSVLDHLGNHQAPSLGLSWTTPQNGTFLGNNIAQNSRMQQLYQRLMIRSSTTTTATNNYSSDHYNSQPVVLMSNASSSSASSLDSAPVTGESGYGWNHVNPAFSWSDDLPTTNGAYP